ncbi:11470_t:CDS:2, partial [Acaulospora colombiana]
MTYASGLMPSTNRHRVSEAAKLPDSLEILEPLDRTAVKPYNWDIPITPVAVTRPVTTKQLSRVVQCASASGVKVQARSGGHSYANYCLGGESGALVIDMKNFQKFEMDTNNWFATFGSGTRLGDLTDRLYNHGARTIAHGTCPSVSHLTIGGLGPLSRQYGTALDHVEEVEVVLANGTITRASNTHYPDLFFVRAPHRRSESSPNSLFIRNPPRKMSSNIPIISSTTTTSLGEKPHLIPLIRTGNKSAFASTFATWQDIVKDPQLDRKLATTFIIMELGMIISGTCCLDKASDLDTDYMSLGTYFGTREEYDALQFEQRLGNNATVNVIQLDNWLGTVTNWAENEALKLIGGISMAFTEDSLIPADGIQNLFDYLETTPKGTPAWFVIFDLQAGK